MTQLLPVSCPKPEQLQLSPNQQLLTTRAAFFHSPRGQALLLAHMDNAQVWQCCCLLKTSVAVCVLGVGGSWPAGRARLTTGLLAERGAAKLPRQILDFRTVPLEPQIVRSVRDYFLKSVGCYKTSSCMSLI